MNRLVEEYLDTRIGAPNSAQLGDILMKEQYVQNTTNNGNLIPRHTNIYTTMEDMLIKNLSKSCSKLKEDVVRKEGLKDVGVKHNEGKLPLDTMITTQFPQALKAICKATMFGHERYKEVDSDFLNFKRVKGGSQTYADALQRHNLDKKRIDKESGLPNIYHKAWNALAELELWIEENQVK